MVQWTEGLALCSKPNTRIIKRFGLLIGTFFKVREDARWVVMSDSSFHSTEAFSHYHQA